MVYSVLSILRALCEKDCRKNRQDWTTRRGPPLFSGTLDGRTVLEEQRDAALGLTCATRITVENAGHNLFDAPTAEVLSALDQFMTNRPVTPGTDVVIAPRLAPENR